MGSGRGWLDILNPLDLWRFRKPKSGKSPSQVFSVIFLLPSFFFAIALFLIACTPKYGNVTPELRTQFLTELQAGKTTLTCVSSCHWSWLQNFNQMMTLHNAGQWESLAVLVMQIGHEMDLAYYFLGRAAEGFGYSHAAISYYQVSAYLTGDSNKLHHCREWQFGCGGIDLASVLAIRLTAVQSGKMAQTGLSPMAVAAASDPLPSTDTFNGPIERQATYEHDLSAGPVIIHVHEDCTGRLGGKACSTSATLSHANAQLAVDEIGQEIGLSANQWALSANDVGWVDNRFVTLAYNTGGTCSSCSGLHVVAFEEGKFFNLGKYDAYQNGSLIKTYAIPNGITSSVAMPKWPLYFSFLNHQAVLNLKKTCADQKIPFAQARAESLKQLPRITTQLKTLNRGEFDRWAADELSSPLLYALGVSKFCGWKSEHANLWAAAEKKTNSQSMVVLKPALLKVLENVRYGTVKD
jgi:hypothetical protein